MSSENKYIGFKRKGYFDNKSIFGQVAVNNDQLQIEEKDEVIELSSDLEENEQKKILLMKQIQILNLVR